MVPVLVNFPLLCLELQHGIAFFFDLELVRILVNLYLQFFFCYSGVH